MIIFDYSDITVTALNMFIDQVHVNQCYYLLIK